MSTIKSLKLMFFIFFCLCGIFTTSFLYAASPKNAATFDSSGQSFPFQGKGMILYVEGNVEVGEKDVWRTAKEDEEVPPGVIVRTGGNGKVILLIDGRVSVRLGANSKATFKSDKSEPKKGLKISILLGEFWVQVQKFFKTGEPIYVETQTAIAAVKGTIFHGEVSKAGDLQLMVDEGALEIQAGSKTWEVKSGEGIQRAGNQTKKIQLELTRFALWNLQKGIEIENKRLVESILKLARPVVIAFKERDLVGIIPPEIIQDIIKKRPPVPELEMILRQAARVIPAPLLHFIKDGMEIPSWEVRKGDAGLFFFPTGTIFIGRTPENDEAIRCFVRNLLGRLSPKLVEGKMAHLEKDSGLFLVNDQELLLPLTKEVKIISPASPLIPGDDVFLLVKDGAIQIILKKPRI